MDSGASEILDRCYHSLELCHAKFHSGHHANNFIWGELFCAAVSFGISAELTTRHSNVLSTGALAA